MIERRANTRPRETCLWGTTALASEFARAVSSLHRPTLFRAAQGRTVLLVGVKPAETFKVVANAVLVFVHHRHSAHPRTASRAETTTQTGTTRTPGAATPAGTAPRTGSERTAAPVTGSEGATASVTGSWTWAATPARTADRPRRGCGRRRTQLLEPFDKLSDLLRVGLLGALRSSKSARVRSH